MYDYYYIFLLILVWKRIEFLNKKENDLLLNRVDDYPFKKELLKEVDFNKPIDEKYGIYKWNTINIFYIYHSIFIFMLYL